MESKKKSLEGLYEKTLFHNSDMKKFGEALMGLRRAFLNNVADHIRFNQTMKKLLEYIPTKRTK